MFARTLGILNYFIIVLTIVAASYFSDFAYAADPLPGSACSVNNSRIRSGGPESAGVIYDMTCQGGVWVATLTFATNSFVGVGTTNPGNSIHTRIQDSATNTVTNLLRLEHETTGTPAANFGTGLLFTGESDTTLNRDMAQISSLWTTATDASRASALTFSTLRRGFSN